jgi:hypothetical protein
MIDIVKSVSKCFPFDERNDLPDIKSEKDLLNLYGTNEKGDRFYLTPHLIAFYRALEKDSYINKS